MLSKMEESATERLSTEYLNHSERFSKQSKDFNKQYCNIYTQRLNRMKPLLESRVAKKWGNKYPICELHKLSVNDYPKCVVIATLFKDQKLKPSVVKELSEANSLVPQPVYTHFTDESDTLYIEDEMQRSQLLGPLLPKNIVTGVSIALLGTDIGNGKFMVEDYCFADFQTQIHRPIMQSDMHVVFISGLDLVRIDKSLLSLRLFVSWISGLLGDINSIEISKIVRLIVAGNSTRTTHEKAKPTMSMTSKKTEMPELIESIKLLDSVLLELAQVMEVDVMPGEHDPSNHILPQQAMHHNMFPKSMAYKSLNQVTNPYECEIGGVRILGSSGQPIKNILGYSDIDDPLETLESCLKWSNIAPTAPDTLGSFPFYNNDPFIIEHCPHVMFAGNQETFKTNLCKGEDGQQVRLICIPEFANSFTVAVLNLKNLDCVPVSFKTL